MPLVARCQKSVSGRFSSKYCESYVIPYVIKISLEYKAFFVANIPFWMLCARKCNMLKFYSTNSHPNAI